MKRKDSVLKDMDELKIKILRLLISQPRHAILDKEIIKITKVSPFRLQKIIEELKVEIDEYIPDVDVWFEYTENELIVHDLNLAHIKVLRLEYIARSNSFKIMRYNQFESEYVNLQDFLEENEIGQPNYYHLRKELEPLLERNAVFSIVPTYIDNFEFVKRRKLAALFYSYYSDVRDPFPQVTSVVDELIELIFSLMPLPITAANTAKLRVCISVQLMRIKNKKFLKNYSVPVTSAVQSVADQFATIFEKFADDPSIDSQTEAVFLLSMLYSQIVVKNPDKYDNYIEVDAFIQSKNKTLYNFIHNILISNSEATSLGFTDEQIEQKIDYILRLNEWLLVFDLQFIDGVPAEIFEGLVAKYPQRALVAEDYVSKLVATFDIELAEKSMNYLKYNFLIGFMEIIPNESVNKNVNITLDFANNFAFADYVATMLRRYPAINIVDGLCVETDIYMTDSYSRVVDVPQIVWEHLPNKQQIIEMESLVQHTQFEKIKDSEYI